MGYEPTVFNQLFNFILRHAFEKSVNRFDSDRYAKSFKTWHQFLLLLYAQASGKQTLRDIESGLQVHSSRLYHLGLNPVPHSTISDGLERRDSVLFEELFHEMVRRTARLAPKHKFRFNHPLYSIDATTIDLCLSVFDWAKFRKQKGAIKFGHLEKCGHGADMDRDDLLSAAFVYQVHDQSRAEPHIHGPAGQRRLDDAHGCSV
jgi:hypothetical protein